jgi:hypothetical protein
MRRKIEDERAEIAQVHQQLAADQQRTAERKASMQEEIKNIRIQNRERFQAKQVALVKSKAEDKALMEETMRTLEKQEADRAQALKDFHVHCPFLPSRAVMPLLRFVQAVDSLC